jgi:hypothetical protein
MNIKLLAILLLLATNLIALRITAIRGDTNQINGVRKYVTDQYVSLYKMYKNLKIRSGKTDTLKFVIKVIKNGKVVKTQIQRTTFTDTSFLKSVLMNINSWKFPDTSWTTDTTEIIIPLLFNMNSSRCNMRKQKTQNNQ